MKLFSKILCLALCLCMVASLAACGNSGNKPAADENQTDFYVVGGMSALSAGYDSNIVLNKMQEDAGITIEWDTMSDSLSEQVNIRIAGEQLPDAFQGVGFNNYDLATYGADGVFIDLTPYITPEVMPNLARSWRRTPTSRPPSPWLTARSIACPLLSRWVLPASVWKRITPSTPCPSSA